MVPLDRAIVSSYKLSIVTMSLSAAVWAAICDVSIWGHCQKFMLYWKLCKYIWYFIHIF